jgi:predicted O-methyltransferase YrrM
MSLPYANLDFMPPVVNTGIWKKPGDWFMTAYERDMLVALAKSINAATVIETGVQIGGAAKEILSNVPTVQNYVGIDILPTSVPNMPQQASEVPEMAGHLVRHDKRFKLLLSSNGSLDLEPLSLPMCDLFLIDGDHSRKGVLHDTMLARALVRRGGIILWHDYNEECVVDSKAVIDEMHAEGHAIERIFNTWFAMERR